MPSPATIWPLAASIVAGAVLTAGCASQPADSNIVTEEVDASVEETLVYLKTLNPPTVDSIRFREPLRYDVLNVRFAYMDVKTGRYLIEMARDCKPLKSNDIYTDMADRRSMRGRLRAGVDTLRGCRIETIYELPEVAETRAQNTGPTDNANGDNEDSR